MTINEIIEYVLFTPTNTNKVILKGMIETLLKESGEQEPAQEVTSEQAILDALASDEPVITVKLASAITLSENFVVPEGKTLNIELNGKKISTGTQSIIVNGKVVVSDDTGQGEIVGSGRPFNVTDGGELTIENGVIQSTNDTAISVSNNGTVIMNNGIIKAQEVGILTTTGATVVMNNGLITTTDNFCIGGNGNAGQGGTNITINGGKLDGHITSSGYVACGIYQPQDGTLTINGGEIVGNGGCGICIRSGELVVNGGTIIGTGDSDLLGKVGDSRVVVGPDGIVFDQASHYPDNQNLSVTITDGIVIGEVEAISIIKDDTYEEDINITGGWFNPGIEETTIYDGGRP